MTKKIRLQAPFGDLGCQRPEKVMKIVEQQSLLSFRYYFCHFNLMTLRYRLFFIPVNLNFGIGRNCCVGVDSVTDCNYNNYIESA